jgi:SAM-dependent methyltransferase
MDMHRNATSVPPPCDLTYLNAVTHTRGHMDQASDNGRASEFSNVYADRQRAESYAKLDFPGTYLLAFRDLPAIIGSVASGATALDFGCGAGRSTRFLRRLGFDVVGVDISEHMLALAREADPGGTYRLVSDGGQNAVEERGFDFVLSAFTFDNVPGWENKERLFRTLGASLRDDGRLINLVSSPEIYVHEWASFSTKEFATNAMAKTGDVVRTVMLDVADRRPVDDIFWTDADYREVYRRAGLAVREVHRPLGTSSDPCTWVSETRVAPWTIYVLMMPNR